MQPKSVVTTRRTTIVRVVCVQKRSKLWKTYDERTIIVRFFKNVDQTQTGRSTSSASLWLEGGHMPYDLPAFSAQRTQVERTATKKRRISCDRPLS